MTDLEWFLASPEFAAASSHEERCRLVAEHLAAHNGPDEVPVDVDYQRRPLETVPQHSLPGLTRQQRGQWYAESDHADEVALIGWTREGEAIFKLTRSQGQHTKVSFRRIQRDGWGQLMEPTPARDRVVFWVTQDDDAHANPRD